MRDFVFFASGILNGRNGVSLALLVTSGAILGVGFMAFRMRSYIVNMLTEVTTLVLEKFILPKEALSGGGGSVSGSSVRTVTGTKPVSTGVSQGAVGTSVRAATTSFSNGFGRAAGAAVLAGGGGFAAGQFFNSGNTPGTVATGSGSSSAFGGDSVALAESQQSVNSAGSNAEAHSQISDTESVLSQDMRDASVSDQAMREGGMAMMQASSFAEAMGDDMSASVSSDSTDGVSNTSLSVAGQTESEGAVQGVAAGDKVSSDASLSSRVESTNGTDMQAMRTVRGTDVDEDREARSMIAEDMQLSSGKSLTDVKTLRDVGTAEGAASKRIESSNGVFVDDATANRIQSVSATGETVARDTAHGVSSVSDTSSMNSKTLSGDSMNHRQGAGRDDVKSVSAFNLSNRSAVDSDAKTQGVANRESVSGRDIGQEQYRTGSDNSSKSVSAFASGSAMTTQPLFEQRGKDGLSVSSDKTASALVSSGRAGEQARGQGMSLSERSMDRSEGTYRNRDMAAAAAVSNERFGFSRSDLLSGRAQGFDSKESPVQSVSVRAGSYTNRDGVATLSSANASAKGGSFTGQVSPNGYYREGRAMLSNSFGDRGLDNRSSDVREADTVDRNCMPDDVTDVQHPSLRGVSSSTSVPNVGSGFFGRESEKQGGSFRESV